MGPCDKSLKILTAVLSCSLVYFSCADLRHSLEGDVMGEKACAAGDCMDGSATPGVTPSSYEKARYFHSLHVRGQPLVLFNIWDAGSAKVVEGAGARALATGSWSVAAANGYEDGERVPLDFAIENLARIVRATDLPVTIDLETGYGRTPDAVGRTIERSIDAGAIGCNIEDSDQTTGCLRDIADQVARIERARKAAGARQLPYFINVRSDVFFVQAKPQTSDDERIASVLERARAYAAAGADGLFVPGLANASLIGQLGEASPLPVNIMVSDQTPSLRELASLGVARVSHGPRPYLSAMKKLREAACEAARMA
jgi:2-methylisocitrate lyase-like PEP mutase family enzyme